MTRDIKRNQMMQIAVIWRLDQAKLSFILPNNTAPVLQIYVALWGSSCVRGRRHTLVKNKQLLQRGQTKLPVCLEILSHFYPSYPYCCLKKKKKKEKKRLILRIWHRQLVLPFEQVENSFTCPRGQVKKFWSYPGGSDRKFVTNEVGLKTLARKPLLHKHKWKIF